MERFGNSAFQFSSSRQRETKTDLSTIASATVEADTCREYVVPMLQAGNVIFLGPVTDPFTFTI